MSIALVYQGGPRARLPVVQEMIHASRSLPGLVLAELPYNLDQNKVYPILESLYRRGIRSYIGWEGSQVLEAGLPFLRSHPDVRAISIGSSSTTLALRDNIWRLSLPDLIFVKAMNRYAKSKGYKNILLLWDQDGAWPVSMAKDIQTSINLPIIPMPFKIRQTIQGPSGHLLSHDLHTLLMRGEINPKDTLSILLLAKDLDLFFQETRPFWLHGYHLIAGDGAEGYQFPDLEDVALATKFMVVQNNIKGHHASNTIAAIFDAYRLAKTTNIQNQILDGDTGLLVFNSDGDRLYGQVSISQFIPGQGYISRHLLSIDDPKSSPFHGHTYLQWVR